jgi:hypothetical protein
LKKAIDRVKMLEGRLKNKKGKKHIHANSLEKKKVEKKELDSDSGTSGSAELALAVAQSKH